MVYSRAESWDFVENNMYNKYKNTQISILGSHSPEPKQEGGKRNSSVSSSFLLQKCMMQGGEGGLQYIGKNPGLFSMGTFDFQRYPLLMTKMNVFSLLIMKNFVSHSHLDA